MLGICIPLVIIITVVAVIFIVKKKRNQDIEQNLPDENAAETLVRPTTTSSTAWWNYLKINLNDSWLNEFGYLSNYFIK